MRIAFLAPLVTPIAEPQLGGAQALLSDIAAGLTDRGHTVNVFAATGSRIEGAHVVDVGVDPAELHDALVRPADPDRPRSTGTVRRAYTRAWSLIAENAYDLVHSHAFDAAAIDGGEGIGYPVVHTLHLPPPDAEITTALQRTRTRPNPPLVATVSRAHGMSWAEIVRVDAILPNGVPTDRIPFGADGGDRALFAGRLSPEKGAADAIEIARRADVGIDLIGAPYDPDYAASLDATVEDSLPRAELWKRMASARAVLCPIRWDEPFGLVAAEAQAAGTPVVGFRRGGLPEVVADGQTGRLVDPGDVDAAARALIDIGEIDRHACRAHAEQHLDLADVLDAHEELYEGVLFEDGAMRRRAEESDA